MMSMSEAQLTSARWDRLSDDWNSYRQNMGLETYSKDVYRNLGSYDEEE